MPRPNCLECGHDYPRMKLRPSETTFVAPGAKWECRKCDHTWYGENND